VPRRLRNTVAGVGNFEVLLIFITNILFVVDISDPAWFPIIVPSFLRWLGVFALIVWRILRPNRSMSLPATLPSLCFGVFVGVALCSTLVHGEQLQDGAYRSGALVLVYILAFALYNSSTLEATVRAWSSALFAATLAACLASVALISRADAYTSQGRFLGIFKTPNSLGHYAAILIVFLLVKGHTSRGAKRWCILALTAAPGYCVYASGSRTNMVAVPIVCVALVSHFGIAKFAKWAIAIALIAAAGLALLGPGIVPVTILQRDYSLDARQSVWQIQWEVFKSEPLIGYGLAGGTHSIDFDNPMSSGRAGGECSYGDLLTVAGFLGCAPLFLGGAIALRALYRQLRDRSSGPWPAEAFFIIALILIVSIGDGWLAAMGTMTQYVWVVFAAVTAPGARRRRYPAPSPRFWRDASLRSPQPLQHPQPIRPAAPSGAVIEET
jgi:O-antigen ligase